MRIKRLAVAGFGPYKNQQRVDFERFENDGLFLITGKTGAGKSSILDAICFALYGTVPRYDGAEQKLRSDHAEPDAATTVELEFTVDAIDYRITRSPAYERVKKNGKGTTQQKAAAELFVGRDGEWQGVAARPVDVGHEIGRIVGLTREQFLQVILLAQNRFQDFLLAGNEDRQKVLRNLFGTRRFEQFEAIIVERRKALDVQLNAAREALALDAARAASVLELEVDHVPTDPDLEWFEIGFVALSERRHAAAVTAAHADESSIAANTVHQGLERLRDLQLRRDDARTRRDTLDADRDTIARDRAAVDAARRAASVWPHLTAQRDADEALRVARDGEASAREEYLPFTAHPNALTGDVDAISTTIESATRELGTLDTILAEELTLPELAAEIDSLEKRRDELTTSVHALVEKADSLPVELEKIVTLLGVLHVRASAELDAKDAVARLTAARVAATTAIALEPQHSAALVAETQASAAHSAAGAHIHDLLQQRLAGHAAELAAGLRRGEPCAVCGATSHPNPAAGNGDLITEHDVELARAVAEERRTAMDAAHDLTTRHEKRLTEARAKADGKNPGQLDAELDDARARLLTANSAAAEAVVAAHEHSKLKAELTNAAARLSEMRDRRDDAATALDRALTRRASVDEKVAHHRGEYGTVAERATHLQAMSEAARFLMNQLDLVSRRTDISHTATVSLAAQLAEHGFAADASVVEARLPAAEIATIEARIREFDDAVAAVSATLAAPELTLDTLPLAPIDLEPSTSALAAASAARDTAMAANSSLGVRVEQLGKVVASARARLAASARLLNEHRQLRELAGAVEGKEPNEKRMRLETYVLAARLEEIVDAANARLRTMTSGRYTLEHDDALQYRNTQSGLGLAIRDEHSGRARATHSLSGGETFLASLALALGLAEVVTNQAGGIRLDTLFIDEGFGSLDSDTLEIAMSTLDGLRAGGRTIGLISHVDAMKEQIPAHLEITVTSNGWSEIEESYAMV